MKEPVAAHKPTRQTELSRQPGSAGERAVALTPPPYGIGFADTVLQAQPSVGRPDDPCEHEADRVADQVMQTATSPRTTSAVFPETAARKAPGIVDQALRSPGQPLDAGTRRYFEPRFGLNFATVRVHTDDAATRSAAAIGARAYTYGSHIVFAAGERPAADRLTAHELTHVAQDVSGREPPVIRRTPAVDPFEIISPVWNVAGRDVVMVRMKADGRTFFFYRRSGLGNKGQFQARAPKPEAWVPFEGFEETEVLRRRGETKFPDTYERFHKDPYYYSPAVAEGQVPPGYGTQTQKNIADWLDNKLPAGSPKGTVADWRDVQRAFDRYNPRNLPSPGREAPPRARTAAGEVTVPQRGSVTPQGGTPRPATTAAGEVTVPQRGSVTPSGGTPRPVTTAVGEIDVPTPAPTGGAGGRLGGIKAGLALSLKEAFSAGNIASMIPDVILAIADRAAYKDAIRTIQIKFLKEGFARGFAAGVMEWSKAQVDLDLKNLVTEFRMRNLGDPAGFLKVSDIYKIATAYENYAVDVGYQFSSSKTSNWRTRWQTYGFKLLDKYGYSFAGDREVYSFRYYFIDKLAWVLHRATDRIVEEAIDRAELAKLIERFK